MFWSVRALAAEIMGAYSDVSSAALRSPGGRDQGRNGSTVDLGGELPGKW
jgi:hypothetical protein